MYAAARWLWAWFLLREAVPQVAVGDGGLAGFESTSDCWSSRQNAEELRQVYQHDIVNNGAQDINRLAEKYVQRVQNALEICSKQGAQWSAHGDRTACDKARANGQQQGCDLAYLRKNELGHAWGSLGTFVQSTNGLLGDTLPYYETAARILPDVFSPKLVMELSQRNEFQRVLEITCKCDEKQADANCASSQAPDCSSTLCIEWGLAKLEIFQSSDQKKDQDAVFHALFPVFKSLSNIRYVQIGNSGAPDAVAHMIRGLYVLIRVERKLGLSEVAYNTALAMNSANCNLRARQLGDGISSGSQVSEIFKRDVLGTRRYFSSAHFQNLFPHLSQPGPLIESEEGHHETCGVKRAIRPIFIIGLPRSGSSLLEQLLSSHSQIIGAGEVFGLEAFLSSRECDNNLNCSPTGAELGDPERRARIKDMYLRALEDAAIKRNSAPTKKNYSFIIDKMLLNWVRIPLIRAVFPDAVIVHVVRDLADTATSNLFQPYADAVLACNTATFSSFADYADLYARTISLYKAAFPLQPRLVTVRYERLVADTAQELAKVHQALSVPVEPPRQDSSKRSYTASSAQVARALYATAVGAAEPYMDYIAQANIKKIEQTF